MEGETMRIDVGFQGGQVLPVRATKDAYDALVNALQGDGGGRWHRLETQDSEILIDLPQVIYVRRDAEEHRVGF
jgi:hypothetical protein